MREVAVCPLPLARLAGVLPPDRVALLNAEAAHARGLLDGTSVWNLSSTAKGGGVAEMLQTLVAYGRGAGVSTRWLVLEGDAEFFAATKRLHNLLHGNPGDGEELGAVERDHYAEIQARNLRAGGEMIQPGDIVLLHDPQTAGLVEGLKEQGAHVVWRCHIGSDTTNEHTDRGWAFLRPLIESADGFIFSRREYAPGWLPKERVWVIPPSMDPFSAKNAFVKTDDVHAALRHAGLVNVAVPDGHLGFTRRDGSPGVVRRHTGLVLDDDWLPRDARVVMQVSRWDRLKDMTGVLTGFVDHLEHFPDDVHLLLVGPDVSGVSDDPEGAQVLEECRALRGSLSATARARAHLCCLPMDDVDENAHLVNALQRYAKVVVQKSLVEGFGLTVTEPMWKGRAVVASAVGGIQDQIVDGVSGVLLDDPTDLAGFAGLLADLLADPARETTIGAAAHDRVTERYLGDRHLIQYAELFGALKARGL